MGKDSLDVVGVLLHELDQLAVPFAEVEVDVLLLHYDADGGEGEPGGLEVDDCVCLIEGGEGLLCLREQMRVADLLGPTVQPKYSKLKVKVEADVDHQVYLCLEELFGQTL